MIDIMINIINEDHYATTFNSLCLRVIAQYERTLRVWDSIFLRNRNYHLDIMILKIRRNSMTSNFTMQFSVIELLYLWRAINHRTDMKMILYQYLKMSEIWGCRKSNQKKKNCLKLLHSP